MGVTAFLVPGANSPKNVHLFYNKRSGNLGVKIKSSINAQEDTNRAYGADDQDRPGIIVQSSHLDHTMISNMRIIVGVVESAVKSAGKCSACGCDKCGCPEKTHDVAIVSPYYQKITTTPADITSLAVAADDVSDTVWVYSLTGGDDKTANLTSTTVSLGTYTPLAIEPNNKPAIRDSALSAHFNTVLQKPFAYYQTNGKKNWFYQYDFETGGMHICYFSWLSARTLTLRLFDGMEEHF
ncbi:hypothetical protein BJ508DRAFT_45170 [Ascobolus immersus RN42]|uniref:Uncharacterized protein n=1 Tax=Ascobolus immersus RN42 TaxID=1160509 RepID=A0A3N4HIR0_ASCIM|nr:hypothetical protein BJ508DRAFT_45170 [Ascobolus immersus RN42]